LKEIFINRVENISKIVLVENGNVIEKYEEDNRKKRLEGKIYLGRVENVLQGMQAAFIDIGEDRNTFIHLKDILPKVNIVKNPDMVKVSSFEGDEDTTIIEVLVSNEDMGAVIGKGGMISKSLRTLVQASSNMHEGPKVKIDIDGF